MGKLIDKIPKEKYREIPLHYLTATASKKSDNEMISFFNSENKKIERIGTDYKLFCNYNKHICKYKL